MYYLLVAMKSARRACTYSTTELHIIYSYTDTIRATLLFASLNRVAVLARNDLYPRRRDHFVPLHLERRLLNDERPHVITITVRVEVSLCSNDAYGLMRESGLTTGRESRTLSVVFALTCFTIVSARDLSN